MMIWRVADYGDWLVEANLAGVPDATGLARDASLAAAEGSIGDSIVLWAAHRPPPRGAALVAKRLQCREGAIWVGEFWRPSGREPGCRQTSASHGSGYAIARVQCGRESGDVDSRQGVMVMIFREVLVRISRDVQDRVRCRLGEIAGESQAAHSMVKNLFRETRLGTADWEALATGITEAPDGPDETARAIVRFCRSGRKLRGGKANVSADSVFGRVVPQEKLCSTLMSLRCHGDTDMLRAWLRSQVALAPSRMSRTWKNCPMGEHLIWATLDSHGGREPFGVPLAPGSDLLCALGMPPEGGPVLLLEYELPIGVHPMVPTICDAYAADTGFWPEWFRSAPPGAAHGWTIPTDICPVQEGRPEVVHDVVKFSQLVKPMRYAP
jgi:hypothetical protein